MGSHSARNWRHSRTPRQCACSQRKNNAPSEYWPTRAFVRRAVAVHVGGLLGHDLGELFVSVGDGLASFAKGEPSDGEIPPSGVNLEAGLYVRPRDRRGPHPNLDARAGRRNLIVRVEALDYLRRPRRELAGFWV